MQGASIDARLDHSSAACRTAYRAAAWGVRSADDPIARDGFEVRNRSIQSAPRRRSAKGAVRSRGDTDGGFRNVATRSDPRAAAAERNAAFIVNQRLRRRDSRRATCRVWSPGRRLARLDCGVSVRDSTCDIAGAVATR